LHQGFNVALMAHKRDGCSPVETELMRHIGPYLEPHPKRDGYIYTPTGAEVHIWTLGNKATSMRAGRGESYGTIVVDEAAWCSGLYEAFLTAIQPTLADHAGYIIFASTPRGQKNDFFRIFRALADVRFEGSTADCNPLPNIQEFYKEQKHKAALGKLNPKYFRQEYEGEFVDLEDALVTQEMLQEYPIEPELPNAEVWQIHVGMDLAISLKEEADFTAMVAVAKHRSTGTFFVCDVKRFKQNLPSRMLEELRLFCKRWQPSKIAIESTQFQTAVINEWMAQTDLPIVPVRPEKDKKTRFAPTASKYASSMIWHSQNLPQHFEDELTLFPICEHDDQVDALAYAVMSFGSYWDEDQGSGKHWGRGGDSQERESDQVDAA
jgi:predicted phage terminase large subunit-like protein